MIDVLMAPLRWTRALYDWVLKWSESKHSLWALFFLSMAEASFFPVPPDALLIALCMGAYRRWAKFALVCSIGSVIGGVMGYLIGHYAFELIGETMLMLTARISGSDPHELLETAHYWFNEKEMFGFFDMAFIPFFIASAVSRSLRFFVVAGLIGLLYRKYGDRIRQFIDKYFNLLALAFVVLLILGFVTVGMIKGD
jgi:membrane protein YqaA with SNARE-associated domain